MINELRVKYYSLCLKSYLEGDTRIFEIIQWYGIKKILDNMNFVTDPSRGFVSIFHLLEREILIGRYKSGRFKYNCNQSVEDLGNIALTQPTPWLDHRRDSGFLGDLYEERIPKNNRIGFDKVEILESSLFGCFIVFAFRLENSKIYATKIFEIISKEKLNAKLVPIFKFRLRKKENINIQSEIAGLTFNDKQREFVLKWANREINFIGEKTK